MTIRKTARFRVGTDLVADAVEVISDFLAHTRTEQGTIRYECWQSPHRPTEFLHLMEFVDTAAEMAHRSSAAVKTFTDELYPLCIDPPSFDDWHQIS